MLENYANADADSDCTQAYQQSYFLLTHSKRKKGWILNRPAESEHTWSDWTGSWTSDGGYQFVCECVHPVCTVKETHVVGNWVSNGDGTHSGSCTAEGCADSSHIATMDCNGAASCTEPAFCTECNAAYGSALDHDWDNWVSNGDGTHSRTCLRDAGHTESKNCSGGTATTTNKAVCADCGGEYGTLLIPQTSDGMNFALWTALLALSAIGIACVLRKVRKEF